MNEYINFLAYKVLTTCDDFQNQKTTKNFVKAFTIFCEYIITGELQHKVQQEILTEEEYYLRKLTLCSVSSMTIKIGLSSFCIFLYKEFNEKPCCDVLKTNDHE